MSKGVQWQGSNLQQVKEMYPHARVERGTGGSLSVYNEEIKDWIAVLVGDWLREGDTPGSFHVGNPLQPDIDEGTKVCGVLVDGKPCSARFGESEEGRLNLHREAAHGRGKF